MSSRSRVHGSACFAVATMLLGSVASAQTASDVAAAEGPLEEVVVTAEKRPTLSRNVTGSVSVLTDKALDEARITSIEDAVRLIPGVELSKTTQLQFPIIRGVAPQLTGSPAVAVLQDGFGFANYSQPSVVDMFDVSRFEVLKGPQASLYGQNSLGGVFNIISKLPSLTEVEGDLRASYGSFDSAIVRGAISLPVAKDVFGIRLGAYVNSRDGYWDNLYNGRKGQDAQREKGARVAARFRPTDNFESSLVYSHSDQKRDCADCTNPILGFSISDPTSIGQGRIDTDNLGEFTNTNIPGFLRTKVDRATWNNELDMGAVRLISLTGYGEFVTDAEVDLDRGPGDTYPFIPGVAFLKSAPFTNEGKVFSEELRLASDGEGRLKWQVGAFYGWTKGHTDIAFDSTIGLIPIPQPWQRSDTYALFTHNVYSVTDRFDLTLGLRYDIYETKTGDAAPFIKTENKIWLPKVGVLYKINEYNNIYATVSKGYKPGGLNTVAGAPTNFKSESIWNSEVGLKGVTADRKLRYDVSAFFLDWTDQQVLQLLTGTISYTSNAGHTRIYGAEAALSYSVTSRFTVDASVSYLNARFVDFIDVSAIPAIFGLNPDREGEAPFGAPDLTVNVAGRYVHPINGGYDITVNGDVRYTGSRSLDGSALLKGDPYVLANFGISVGDDRKRLTLFANNAFDARYTTSDLMLAGVEPATHYGSPRVVGVQADFKF